MHSVVAINIVKKVSQLPWAKPANGSSQRRKVKRGQLLEWFAARQPFGLLRRLAAVPPNEDASC